MANRKRSNYSHVVPAHTIKICILLAGFLTACGPKTPTFDYSQEPDPRRSEYVIGVEDALDINVWNNEQLTTSATVRPDGTITIPLVGDVVAAGETPTKLRGEIANRLEEYVKLNRSEITVAVTQVNSYRFTVSGQVARPGMIQSKSYLTVAQALAAAGGFTTFAKPNSIVITRRGKGGLSRQIPIVYKFIEEGTHPEMNVVMLPGDSLYVP